MVEIKFDGGIVREIRGEDIPQLASMCNGDAEIRRFFSPNLCLSSEKYWQGLIRENREALANPDRMRLEYHLSIEQKGEVKGVVELCVKSYLGYAEKVDQMSLGYFVGKKHRGKGITKKVVSAALPFVFEYLEANKLFALCHLDNLPSRRILDRNGFNQLGVGHNLFSAGQFELYSLAREEFLSRNKTTGNLAVSAA